MSTSSRIVNPLIGALVLTVLALSQARASDAKPVDSRPILASADSAMKSPAVLTHLALAGSTATSVALVRDAGSVSAPASRQQSQTRPEPKVWMLVAIGVFLIGSISHRRLTAQES